ncbi:MAG: serine O-acetyltransferase [bacterium]
MLDTIREDLRSVLERDPAARNRLQVALLYSGLHAIWAYRLANRLHRRGFQFMARALSQAARFFTGVEIHPASTIGRRFFIDHGTGVIIGETASVGDDVLLYQGVTLGGTGKESGKRHPTLGDRVVVGAGAKILGNIRVGSDTRVGANSVVLRDVPAHSTVVGIPGRVVRRRKGDENEVLSHQNLPDPTMEALVRLSARVEALEGGAKRKAPRRSR